MNKQQPKGASADVGCGLILPGSSKQAKTCINTVCQAVHAMPWQYYLDDSKHPD